MIGDDAVPVLVKSFLDTPNLKVFDGSNNNFKKQNIVKIFHIIKEFGSQAPLVVEYIDQPDEDQCIASFLTVLDSADTTSRETSQPFNMLTLIQVLRLNNSLGIMECVLTGNASSFFKMTANLVEIAMKGIKFEPTADYIISDALAHNLSSLQETQELTLSICKFKFC